MDSNLLLLIVSVLQIITMQVFSKAKFGIGKMTITGNPYLD